MRAGAFKTFSKLLMRNHLIMSLGKGIFSSSLFIDCKSEGGTSLDRYIHMHITLLRKTGSEEQQPLLN